MRASCLQMGGAAPPPNPRLFKPGKLAWKHMNHVQNKTKHGVLDLAPRHVTAMQMGGAAQPPRFFLPGKLAWKHMNHL